MNDDLDQMRVLYARLTAHQMLALEVIASADVLRAAATALMDYEGTDLGDNGCDCPWCVLRATIEDYAAKRANFERVMSQHENG
jgi:hypothetical protein